MSTKLIDVNTIVVEIGQYRRKKFARQEEEVKRQEIVPVIHKETIIAALNRAAEDSAFIGELSDFGSEALADYDLSPDEKAALVSGDSRWLEKHIGKLDDTLNTWIECRLQQERW